MEEQLASLLAQLRPEAQPDIDIVVAAELGLASAIGSAGARRSLELAMACGG